MPSKRDLERRVDRLARDELSREERVKQAWAEALRTPPPEDEDAPEESDANET